MNGVTVRVMLPVRYRRFGILLLIFLGIVGGQICISSGSHHVFLIIIYEFKVSGCLVRGNHSTNLASVDALDLCRLCTLI